jgi:2,3-bisphosphoglycerate-independent phosphoglycerate mutase
MARRTVVMVVLDGWGVGRKDASNPIYIAKLQTVEWIKHNFPSGTLQASGIAVGLPWGEEGNSEVGHLTLGAGKIIYQHYPRISLAIRNGSFAKNPALHAAIQYAKEKNSRLHLVGLLTENNVHASFEHLRALIRLARQEAVPMDRLNLHLFTDGVDGPPKRNASMLKELTSENTGIRIASIGGRFWGMDRDLHWERTQKAYDTITGAANATRLPDKNPAQYIEETYARELTDTFVEPALFIEDGKVAANDSVIFFNFREDSIRQIVEMFINSKIPGLLMTTLTEYSKKFNLPVAFPPEKITNPLGKVLADNNKVQLRLAESEKYPHITYFFNGYREPPFKNEYRVLIPSKTVVHADEFPEMMAREITARAVSAISENAYDFILINYANPDIIAHTGNFDATVKAVKVVDAQLAELIKAIYAVNGVLIITSDHGNAERLLDPRTGVAETKHDTSPVPIYLIARELERPRDEFDIEVAERESIGVLSDVAPTILEIMRIPKPAEMTGVSFLKLLN